MLLKLITIPFVRIRISPFEQQTPLLGTKPLCTFALEFKMFMKYQKKKKQTKKSQVCVK